jgi:putative acetyltransferase
MEMNIRLAKKADLKSIQTVIETAFSDEESEVISNLASDLSSETASRSIRSLIAEVDGQVVGYVSYSPIFLRSDASISGYILAPLAVSPEHQKQGVGSRLISSGVDMLSADGVDVLLVYGDPEYYGRFGFREEIGRSFVPPYPLAYPFGWLGMMLDETAIPNTPLKFECAKALNDPDLW